VTSRALFLRNVVVVVGAFYTCGQVLAGLWILALQITGSVPIDPILPFGTALLAGLVCGYLLESTKQAAWSAAAGVFVAICTWSSMHWYVKPPLMEVLRYGARAVSAGVVTGITCWIVWRRRLHRNSAGVA
jgi:hypothetical protein